MLRTIIVIALSTFISTQINSELQIFECANLLIKFQWNFIIINFIKLHFIPVFAY